jgi:hypothetical protein
MGAAGICLRGAGLCGEWVGDGTSSTHVPQGCCAIDETADAGLSPTLRFGDATRMPARLGTGVHGKVRQDIWEEERDLGIVG